jgi:coenzyme PQQ precursor peptide PqqA
MSWRKPKVTRSAVGCEINAYACAVLLLRGAARYFAAPLFHRLPCRRPRLR